MKKLLATILSIIMIISIVPMGVISASAATGNTTEFAGGSGTADDPYLISAVDHLDNVRYYLDAHFKMVNDIDLTQATTENGDYNYSGRGWNPIGGTNYYRAGVFTGVFDGNKCSVNGMQINISTSENTNSYIYVGLFSSNSGTIKNLNISGTISVSVYNKLYIRAGGISGDNTGEIVNCSNNVTITVDQSGVSGEDYIGGITGNNKGTIDSCYNAGDLKCDAYFDSPFVGGISGYGDYGIISNCYNTGSISAKQHKSGSFSYHAYTGGIEALSSDASSSSSYYSPSTRIENCYNIGNVSASANGQASRPAIAYGNIYNCYYLEGVGTSKSGSIALTSKQMQKQASFTSFDFVNVWTMGGDSEFAYPELQSLALSGKIGIKNDISYLSTVEPDLSNINYVDNTFTYEWIIGDIVVNTTDTYTLQASDIGKKLKLKVTGTKKYNQGTLYSDEIIVGKAVQTAKVILPELLLLDDNKLEISTVPEQEYSLDNANWQLNGVFANLDPNKQYTVYSRILENDLYLLGESASVLTVTTQRRPLTGSISIVGTSHFGNTLTANVSAVGPDAKATYRYEWKRGNEVVGTGSTYKIVKDDINNNITLSVIGTDGYIGTLTSAAVTAIKASVQTPTVPVVENKTNNTIKLVEKLGYEYSKDKTNWQDSPMFEGLYPNTEYTFYQRVAETETEFASKSSNGTKATTLKNTISAPAKPVIKDITNNSVTLEKISGYEYSMDGITWQTSNVFAGLSPNTEYTFCQRIVETETDYASAQSGYVTVVTLKNTVSAPVAPVVESATDSSVTLVAINGYEYSKNGTTWQKSNVFGSLEPLETYTFYQRIAETENCYASEKSAGTSFKVKFFASKPSAPVLIEVTNDKIVVETRTGYQYSIDGVNWRRQGTFTGLNPNTTYAVYCRMPENDDYYASVNSNPLNITTLKNTANTPGAPIVLAKTDVSVTLVATNGYEYSKNGIDWQASNIFTDLLPDTEYTFYQRVAETETDYVSEKSLGTTVKTFKRCEIDPQYHIYTSDCDTSCNECGFERQVPDHIYDNACDDTCNVENCGFVRTVGEHKYDNACDVDCNICGDTRTVGEHKYDNACDKSCNICGATRTVGAHKYTNSCDTTCNECGETRSINHTYTNSCDTKCNVCNAIRTIKHTYSNNCDTTCNVCKATRKVGSHKYTNNCDTTCNYCNAKRTIKHTYTNACDTTCNVCKATRSITHSYKTTTTKATLSKNGSIVKKCTVCGKVTSNTDIKYAKTFMLSATNYAYDGKTKAPSVTVKDSAGKTLKKNTDYTITYASGRKNVGTYKVTVKMKGNYSGSKTLTFTIKPTTKSSASLLIGVTSTIGAKSNKSISYSSSNKKVATVSSKGVITAVKAGTATITVKSNGLSQKITVNVKSPYVNVSGTSSMLLKKSVTLKATTNTGAKVKWSSSNTKIATVSSSGKVTGQKAGSATIYAKITYKGKTYTGKYTVKVKNPSLKLNKTSVSIYIGETSTLTATASPKVTVKFKSSNKSVATVSSSGKITAKNKGSATITAYFTYAGKTYSKTCKVTVKKSNFRTLKNHILSEGSVDYDGYKRIGFKDNRNGTVYTTTIKYNSSKDCFVFEVVASGDSLMHIYFELKENQKYINVTMTIDLSVMASADIEYDLKVSEYYKGKSFTYHITTTGLLDPDDYNDLVGTYNDVGFSGWQLLLFSELGLEFKDLGFTNY